MRSFSFFLAISSALVLAHGIPNAAAAQQADRPISSQPAPEIEPDELASIDAESDAATALYVIGLAVHIGGALAAGATGFAMLCIGTLGSCPDHSDAVFLLSGVSAVGLLMYFVGVGLDVHSRGRRNRLLAAELEVSAAPLDGGGLLSVRGRF